MNKTKEAIEAALDLNEEILAQYKYQGRAAFMPEIQKEYIEHYETVSSTLKAVLASLPDEGELAECPFCGSEAQDINYGCSMNHIGCSEVECAGNDAYGYSFFNEEMGRKAIQAWNNRALQQRLDKEIGDE